jgi:hypothetical protein
MFFVEEQKKTIFVLPPENHPPILDSCLCCILTLSVPLISLSTAVMLLLFALLVLQTAHFKIPTDVKHGQELFCSYPACRDGGVKFCYCMHCRIPVAKRNFRIRHHHCDLAPPAPVQVETHRSTTPVSVATGSTAPATAPAPLPSTTTTAATQNQLANLILQSSLSQQLAPPPNSTTAQANTSRLDFLRELCFRSLSPGTLLPCPATNTMVAQLCPPVATVRNVSNSSVATILNGIPPTTANQTETSTVTLPCRARGMPDDHQFQKAHFVIPSDIQHGDELICSYPACRDAGVKFCFCTHCRIPVAKRNFRIRHNHCDFVPPPAIVGDYELSPQMTNNGRRTVICQEIMGDKKPAAATYTTTPPISAGIEISDSDMNSRNDSTSSTKKRKRHRTTLPTPPNTLGSQSYCAQSSAMMLQGGNDRLANNDNRLAMVLAGLLGKRPPKI